MAINRAPFNALIDDDGSNSIGTPWNKAAIAGTILDPVDAALTQPFVDVPFSAANFLALAPMTWSVGGPAIIRNRYSVSAKLFFWSLYISWFSGSNVLGGSPSGTISLLLPAGVSAPGSQFATIDFQAGVAGVAVVGGLVASSAGPRLDITKSAGGNFALSDVPGLVFNLWLEIV